MNYTGSSLDQSWGKGEEKMDAMVALLTLSNYDDSNEEADEEEKQEEEEGRRNENKKRMRRPKTNKNNNCFTLVHCDKVVRKVDDNLFRRTGQTPCLQV